ncbi:putative integral membrane protein [Acanthocheilonema viteae]
MGSELSTGGYLLVAKKIRYEKCLCCRITTAMYAVQFLYILALSVMLIAIYTAHGFTVNAIPNLIYIIVLVAVEISAIFAIVKQWALFIIPFIILLIFVTGLSILLFLSRVYVWFRDGGEKSDLYLTIISNSIIMIIYVFALIVSIRWRKYMIGLKVVKFG